MLFPYNTIRRKPPRGLKFLKRSVIVVIKTSSRVKVFAENSNKRPLKRKGSGTPDRNGAIPRVKVVHRRPLGAMLILSADSHAHSPNGSDATL